jgi:hypothetical protein
MFVSTLALAHRLLDSEAAITGLTQYQSGIWRSSLFGELLVGFVAFSGSGGSTAGLCRNQFEARRNAYRAAVATSSLSEQSTGIA